MILRSRQYPLLAALFVLLLASSCVLGRQPAPVTVEPAATALPATAAPETPAAQGVAISPVATGTPTAAPTSTAVGPSATAQPLLYTTQNILVMGMDHRDKDPDPSWRTDSLMVLAIDRAASRVGVVSIPRDLYLDIPGLGPARINQVDYYGEESRYPGGGPALLRRVLKENFDIPVQNYVRVQMDGLVSLVDALEGVTVTLKCPLYERTPDAYSANGVRDWSLPAGEVFLNGQDAKKFATYRYVTTDFGRAQRQQQLIWAIRNRALQLNVIPRIPALWNALRETFTSDLGLLDIINLATLGAGLKPDNVRGMVWNTDVLDYAWTDEGASVLVVKDKKKMLEELSHLFDARPLASLSSNGTGANGACPPRPTAIPAFTPTPVVTATVSITATVPLTGTVLPPPTETPKGP